MPDTNEVRRRIEAAERELAAAKAELAEQPKFEPDALYVITQTNRSYLVRGRDILHHANGKILGARRFQRLNSDAGPGREAGSVSDFVGTFSPSAKTTKVGV